MIARIVTGYGTEWTFPCERFTQHEIEDEPGRFALVFDRPDKLMDVQVESHKDLFVYLMNENGKTIDRRIYRK